MDPTRLPQVPYGPRFGDGARQGPSMDRRTFVALALGGLLAAPLTAEGQQTTKVPRIGFLAGGSRSADSLLLETFWLRLKERGYDAAQRFAERVDAIIAADGQAANPGARGRGGRPARAARRPSRRGR